MTNCGRDECAFGKKSNEQVATGDLSPAFPLQCTAFVFVAREIGVEVPLVARREDWRQSRICFWSAKLRSMNIWVTLNRCSSSARISWCNDFVWACSRSAIALARRISCKIKTWIFSVVRPSISFVWFSTFGFEQVDVICGAVDACGWVCVCDKNALAYSSYNQKGKRKEIVFSDVLFDYQW